MRIHTSQSKVSNEAFLALQLTQTYMTLMSIVRLLSSQLRYHFYTYTYVLKTTSIQNRNVNISLEYIKPSYRFRFVVSIIIKKISQDRQDSQLTIFTSQQ